MSSARSRELLYIGRPVPEKGLPDLLAALQLIQDIPWRLSVAGDLPTTVPAVAAANISFLGRVPHHSVAALMQRHDVLIVPSRYETFGNVALEGLAVGMIVVAAKTGGLKTLITSGRNGFHFEPGDIVNLAETLRFVLASYDSLHHIRGNARTDATLFSWSAVTAATAELLETFV
jgi:glycogen synthase